MNTDTRVIAAAFSEDHTSRLTGITPSQLRYWDRVGFYRPSYAEENRRIAFSRIYSFKDIVALRVLHVLRNQYRVSLQHLREVSDKLSHLAEERWTGTKLYVLNRRVIWIEPGTDLPQELASGQYVVPTMMISYVVDETRRDVVNFSARDPTKFGLVERSRFISHNEPVIAGTRIPVGAIKRFSKAGYGTEQILAEYPGLTPEDVRAALEYAA